MEESKGLTVCCVTGASGYIGSWLVRKLLSRGYTVHATLRNLEDKTKVGLLKSFLNSDTHLVLFQADLDKPEQFKHAIDGCEFVFHAALPILTEAISDKFEGFVESNVSSVIKIADLCIRSGSVRRLIYTGSVVALSPLHEDGIGYKSVTLDESFWTPIHLNLPNINNSYMKVYFKCKTLSEKELLKLNEKKDSNLEVVSLACGLVGGETLLPYLPGSLQTVISQLKGDPVGLQYLEELLGTVPLVHIDDVCEAHIFCMEKASMKGRFLCAAAAATNTELAAYMQENQSKCKIEEELMGTSSRRDYGGTSINNSRLKQMGFQYKYEFKEIIDQSVACGKRLGAL